MELICILQFHILHCTIEYKIHYLDTHGNDVEIVTKGRHDPCVGLRGVPVVEAMTACVLADHWLRYKAQCL